MIKEQLCYLFLFNQATVFLFVIIKTEIVLSVYVRTLKYLFTRANAIG